jgi:hypothetical protein
MSKQGKWRAKADIQLRTLLKEDEKVLRAADGSVGIDEAFITLTDRRVFIFHAWRWSKPEFEEIRLDHITTVHCERGLTSDLVIAGRTGTFKFTLAGRQGRKEAPMWPNWILEAQETIPSREERQ